MVSVDAQVMTHLYMYCAFCNFTGMVMMMVMVMVMMMVMVMVMVMLMLMLMLMVMVMGTGSGSGMGARNGTPETEDQRLNVKGQ
jgi:hypothetical protein